MTTIKLRLDLDTPAGRSAMRAYLDAIDGRLTLPERVPVLFMPAAAAPSEEVRTPTPPLAPSHHEEGATPVGRVEPEAPIIPPVDPDPAPQPDPEPIDAMAEVEDLVEAAEPDWPALVAKVLDLGWTEREVSLAARVHGPSLRARVMHEQRRRRAAVAPPAVEPRPEAVEPEPEPVVASKPAPVDPTQNRADVPDRNGWTLRRDLTLLELYTEGKGSYDISQKLGGKIKPADVINRFRHLVPKPGIVEQRETLNRLKRLVDAADTAPGVVAA